MGHKEDYHNCPLCNYDYYKDMVVINTCKFKHACHINSWFQKYDICPICNKDEYEKGNYECDTRYVWYRMEDECKKKYPLIKDIIKPTKFPYEICKECQKENDSN